MILKTFHFLSGLPRTGSTVIESILQQNPEVYVTPTSPLLHLLNKNQDEFWVCPEILANPFPDMLTNISRGMINGCWEHRSENIIIDKHRGWGKNMPASTIIFEREIKMVITIRDLPSIMSSWLTLLKKDPTNRIKRKLIQSGIEPTDENLMAEMWFNNVLDCVESVCAAKQTASNRLLFVKYDDFISDPKKEILRIESFLNLPSYCYDYQNIVNNNVNDDEKAYGIKNMHVIRPNVEKTCKPPKEVLGENLYNRFVDLEKQYGI